MSSGSAENGPRRLYLCGLSHRCAPVEERELAAVQERSLAEENRALAGELGGEALILSTCNRVELYAAAPEPAAEALRAWFLRRTRAGSSRGVTTQLPPTENSPPRGGRIPDALSHGEGVGSVGGGPEQLPRGLYSRRGPDAVRHLFRVAAGLDSMVLGETDILGQVRAAYQAAVSAQTAGRWLNPLFQSALCAARKVRSRVPLRAGISSVGGAAAAMAGRIFGDLSGARILLVGAGKMAEASAKHLLARKAGGLLVANRSPERALELARAMGGEACGLGEGLRRLSEFDVAVFSTSCPHFLLGPAEAAAAIRGRMGRPLFLIDIAVPRNVDPKVERVDGAILYDIDSLEGLVRESLKERQAWAARAEQEASELAEGFWDGRRRLYGEPAAEDGLGGLRPCWVEP